MSATVHRSPPNEKFWPSKKSAGRKSAQYVSHQKESLVLSSDGRIKRSNRKPTTTACATLSSQQQDISYSNSPQRNQEKKGTLKNNAATTRNQDYQLKIKPDTLTLTSQQLNSSYQHGVAPICSYYSNSNNASTQHMVPPLSSLKSNIHQQQQQQNDLFRKNIGVSSQTPTSPITAPFMLHTEPPIVTDTLNPSTGTTALNTNKQSAFTNKSASRPSHRQLRPTSCTSLREVALPQTHCPISPKPKQFSINYDPTNNKDLYQHKQRHQYFIKRSGTFNNIRHSYSLYPQYSESAQDNTLMTLNKEKNDDAGCAPMVYYMDGDYYCYDDDDDDDDDDDQTLFSNSVLSTEGTKSPPLLSPASPPTRRHSQSPIPSKYYRLPDSSCQCLQCSSQHKLPVNHHQHERPPIVGTVSSADHMCIPYHDIERYYEELNTNSAPLDPMPTACTGFSSTTELQPHYPSSESTVFNRKIKAHQQQQQQQKQQHQQNDLDYTFRGYHLSMDLLKQELENERAVVDVLQRQKDAYNKDITYLCQSVDALTKEENEWKAKYEQEKVKKERYQDDLSVAMEKFSKAIEQIKELTNDNQRLALELEHTNYQLNMEEKTTPCSISAIPSTITMLNPESQQSQQIKLIQTMMEQLLQLDLFGHDECTIGHTKERERNQNKDVYDSNEVSSIAKQQEQHQRKASATTYKSKLSSTKNNATVGTFDNSNTDSRSTSGVDFETTCIVSPIDTDNNQLQHLLQEKELLQAEYSKIPVSGGNAIYRRRREDLEAKLDEVDAKMQKIRLKIRYSHKYL